MNATAAADLTPFHHPHFTSGELDAYTSSWTSNRSAASAVIEVIERRKNRLKDADELTTLRGGE